MSSAPPTPPSPPPSIHPLPDPLAPLSAESFWAVVVRRARYVAAVLAAALLFCTLGWWAASPSPDIEGISLLIGQNHGFFGSLGLALILLVSTAICSLLVHPDSPHMGLVCALFGMAGLSIRGGTIHMLIQAAQHGPAGSYPRLAQLLAAECVQWAVIILVADVFTRLLHERFFANTHWMTRARPDLATQAKPGERPAVGVAKDVGERLKTLNLPRNIAGVLAVVMNSALSLLLLYVLLQAQAKGQVMMACLVAFMVASLLTYLVFSQAPIQAFLLSVPVTAAAGYLLGMNVPTVLPGQASFFAMRALPIDYMAAGVPGAILGYYGGFHWALHSAESEQK